jgi:hypothetical protein
MVLPQDQLSLIRRSSQRMLLGRLTTLEALQDMPRHVGEEIGGLTEETLMARPDAEAWSLKEILGHLRDVGEIGDMRIRMIMTQSLPKLPPISSGWVRERNYQDASTNDILVAYQAARALTIDQIEFIADANWARTGYHPEDGHMSLRQLCERMVAHEQVHLQQLKETKAKVL